MIQVCCWITASIINTCSQYKLYLYHGYLRLYIVIVLPREYIQLPSVVQILYTLDIHGTTITCIMIDYSNTFNISSSILALYMAMSGTLKSSWWHKLPCNNSVSVFSNISIILTYVQTVLSLQGKATSRNWLDR